MIRINSTKYLVNNYIINQYRVKVPTLNVAQEHQEKLVSVEYQVDNDGIAAPSLQTVKPIECKIRRCI